MLSYMCRAYPELRYSTSAKGRQDPGSCQSLPKPEFSVNPFGAGLSWLKAGARDTAGICLMPTQAKVGAGTICSSPQGPKTIGWRWAFVFASQNLLAIWACWEARLAGGGRGFGIWRGCSGRCFPSSPNVSADEVEAASSVHLWISESCQHLCQP